MLTKQNQLLSCTTRYELAQLLELKLSSLTYFAYGKGNRYKKFTIPKKSGGAREISAPINGLLTIQRKLAKLMSEIYPAPSYVQGFVKDGSIVKNASLHLNKQTVLNLDLSEFFPSITVGRVIGLLRARPFQFSNEVASTIARLVCFDGALPQGAPTSPVISNMICRRMDKALCALSKREHATYSRYADDITFSTTKRNFSPAIINPSTEGKDIVLGSELTEIIKNNYFQVNPKKTRLHTGASSKYVTGVKVNFQPNVSRQYVRQVRSMLHAWETYGLDKAQERFSDAYGGGSKSFARVVQGRLAHLKNVKGEDDLVYRRLYNRFVRLEGKGRQELPETEIEDLYSRILVIESGSQNGTGFVLEGKWLITCTHVVETNSLDYFIHTDSMPILHKKIQTDAGQLSQVDKFDLAAFPVPPDLTSKYRTFRSAPEGFEVMTGMTCKVIGFPGYYSGSQPHILPITVTNVQRNRYGILNAYVDRVMISGSSGSPVLDNKNQVVGMVQRGTLDRSTASDKDIGYTFLPIQEIRRCLKEFELQSIFEYLSERE